MRVLGLVVTYNPHPQGACEDHQGGRGRVTGRSPDDEQRGIVGVRMCSRDLRITLNCRLGLLALP